MRRQATCRLPTCRHATLNVKPALTSLYRGVSMSFFDALRAIASRVTFVDEQTQRDVFDAIAQEESAQAGSQADADPEASVPTPDVTTTPAA